MLTTEQPVRRVASNRNSFESRALYAAAALAGILLAWLGTTVWNRQGSSEAKAGIDTGRIDKIEVRLSDQGELLREVRSDVKELLRRTDK